MVARRDDPDDFKPVEIFAREPLERARRDLKQAAATLSVAEVRFLVDNYYEVQAYRIQAANQVRALEAGEEPYSLLSWTYEAFKRIEEEIRKGLDVYSMQEKTGVGAWARCAPPGSMVSIPGGSLPIEQLRDGDRVTAFDRHHSGFVPRPVTVAQRPYSGDLIRTTAGGTDTQTTPEHKWLIRILPTRDTPFVVYLMAQEGRFRIGRSRLFHQRGDDHGRFALQRRAQQERASIWILSLHSTEQEAAIQEEYVATTYGLSEWPFCALGTSMGKHINDDTVAELYARLDAVEQYQRASRCLIDHGRNIEAPLWSWTGDIARQSPVSGLITASTNLLPEYMALPAPTPVKRTVDWLPITAVTSRPYAGPVYSLDVAEHHRYVQNGLVTCNSIVGIGPVIASGFLAHIDIERAPTVGHIWSFAGLNPTATWEKGQKRPWNARLKVLCWKAGQSFVKTSNNPRDVYGKLYQTRKIYEQTRNEAGELAEQAAAILTKKRISKDTDAYKAYSIGRLPPAHIQARAERWAVKAFLSDLHHVMYEQHYKKLPPLPFVVEHEGHVHVRPVPNHVCIGE